MKSFILFVAFLIISNLMYAQEKNRQNLFVVESNLIMSTHFSYDRVVSVIGEKSSLMIGGDYIMGTGFGYGAHWIAPEINICFFGPKHFVETGLQYAIYLNNNDYEGDNDSSPGVRIAYRFQSAKGVIVRFSMNAYFAIDPPIFPTIGLGYAF